MCYAGGPRFNHQYPLKIEKDKKNTKDIGVLVEVEDIACMFSKLFCGLYIGRNVAHSYVPHHVSSFLYSKNTQKMLKLYLIPLNQVLVEGATYL